jgi:surface protein
MSVFKVKNEDIHAYVREYVNGNPRNLPPIGTWDVSNVTNMYCLFSELEEDDEPGWSSNFNEDISNWDVSKVTDMSLMFYKASKFNQPLNTWDVSKVTRMADMFHNAIAFNQPLNTWDVSKVTSMSFMFMNASKFNQPLNTWDVSKVTNMSFMFYKASNFNQPLNTWDVSNVTNMSFMFINARAFNQPLNTWDVSNVTNMSYMFSNTIFNQPLNEWNVSKVINMEGMFLNTVAFNQPLNTWNVGNVRNMIVMFKDAAAFNQPLNEWNVSNVTRMSNMFHGANNFNQSLEAWNFNRNVNISNIGLRMNPPILPHQDVQVHEGRAYEIHNAFGSLDLESYLNLITPEGAPPLPPETLDETNTFIKNSFEPYIASTKERNEFIAIMSRLNRINYTEYQNLIRRTIYYMLNQSQVFKDAYVKTFIEDCYHAYTANNSNPTASDTISCGKGILERFALSVRDAISADFSVEGVTPSDSENKSILLSLFININDVANRWVHEEMGKPEIQTMTPAERREHFVAYLMKCCGKTPKSIQKIQKLANDMSHTFENLELGGGRRKTRKNKRRKTRRLRRKSSKRCRRGVSAKRRF